MKSGATAIILAGGRSSRLFPFNKLLSDLTGSGRSLLQQTKVRLGAFPHDSVYALTTRDMAPVVGRQLKLPASRVLVDPVRRGTWPAILWAMADLRRMGGETVMAILPGDHAIQNDKAYRKAFDEAMQDARKYPAVIMVGITPLSDPDAWRGLGCFQTDSRGQIVQFREKPQTEEVGRMLKEGGWFWNAGMFFFRIAVAEEAMKQFQPDMHRTYMAMAEAMARKREKEAATLFEKFPEKIPHPMEPGRFVDNTIDYAIMTPLASRTEGPLKARAVTGGAFEWTDLGQWSALRGIHKTDSRGNIRIGDVKIGPNVRESILVADEGSRIEVLEADALIIACSGNKALVLPVSDVAQVKELVQACPAGQSIVGPAPQQAAFTLRKRGKLSILSNQSKESL